MTAMHTNMTQRQLDSRIHRFMARKSSWKMLSTSIADLMIETGPYEGSSSADIAYEPSAWKELPRGIEHENFSLKSRAKLTS